jgi:hypothetical protein
MMSDETRSREERACDATRRVLEAANKAAGDAALAELPVKAGDVTLVSMALGSERRDMRAMMLGRTAVSLVHGGDEAAGVGVARALEAFWVGEGQTDERYRPLARVEVGSVLTIQAQGLERLGEVERAVALVEASPGLHDKRRHLAIIAAEALARAERLDEARAMLPAERPSGDVGEGAAWDVVHNLLSDYQPDLTGSSNGRTLAERWSEVVDKLHGMIEQMGRMAGVPAGISAMMSARLEQERAKVPADEGEFVWRLNALSSAMDVSGR